MREPVILEAVRTPELLEKQELIHQGESADRWEEWAEAHDLPLEVRTRKSEKKKKKEPS